MLIDGNYWVKGSQSDWKVFDHKGAIVSDPYGTKLYAVHRGLECINQTRGDLFVENSLGKVMKVYHPQKKDVLGYK